MKNRLFKNLILILSILFSTVIISGFDRVGTNEDSTVTDFDGNLYHTVSIGDQIWLKENLNSKHYSDGTIIPGVAAYNNSDSMAVIYGRLYTWNAAMKNSTTPGTQGVCPNEWHVPSDAEWTKLENYLGGVTVAGGKMKETGTAHWFSPNTGATNSSGLSILAAGEYDAHYSPNIFQQLKESAVFWTSTQISSSKARERYLTYNQASSNFYDWFKVMKYSIRCVKDEPTGIETENEIGANRYDLEQNYPNPFNPSTNIIYSIPQSEHVTLKIFNNIGQEILSVVNQNQKAGSYSVNVNMSDYSSGIYYYQINAGELIQSKKMALIK
ncbi:MAG: FISUMP domain-containing protein [bacterium]